MKLYRYVGSVVVQYVLDILASMCLHHGWIYQQVYKLVSSVMSYSYKNIVAIGLLLQCFFCNAAYIGAALPGNIKDGKTLADIVEPLIPSVVNIRAVKGNKLADKNQNFEKRGDGDPLLEWLEKKFMRPFHFDNQAQKSETFGSGFLVSSDGYIVTNNHVVDGMDEITVNINEVLSLKAKVVGTDKATDLAVLKVTNDKALPFVQFGDSNALRVGDPVIVIGNPFNFGGTVTCGIVSNRSRDIDLDSIVEGFIQTDAAINRGNSGGPMFTLEGKVVGVNFAICSPSGGNAGVGFAIPASYAKTVVDQLIKKGKVERGMLNILTQDINQELADNIGDKNLVGVLVSNVFPGGTASKCGMQMGDIIIKFGDKRVESTRKLRSFLSECPLQSVVKITVIRNGVQKELNAKITADVSMTSNNVLKPHLGSGHIKCGGVIFSDLQYESKKDCGGFGILVKSIEPSSKWREVLCKGDIVMSVVGHANIDNVDQWQRIYSKVQSQQKKWIIVLIKRDNDVFSVKLEVF